ncbi:NAD(P)/FAD-dependent oxidoreductase [Lachnospiraceae bacterium JLR.KK008]
MNTMDYDIVIIGAGAVGCACARELARYRLNIAVLEKEPDVACGTSGRNSAVVHAGFNNKPGSLMARFCVEGNQGFETLCRELDVPYRKTGKYLTAFTEEDVDTLQGLLEQGEANGCEGLALIPGEEMRREEPLVGGMMALHSPNTAIINPFLYTVALAENAKANGVDFFFDRELIQVQRRGAGFLLMTKDGSVYRTSFVINCAGVHSATVAALFGIVSYHIYPCRGEYFILDQEALKYVHTPVYPAPRKGAGGLGVHLTPTIDGNIIIGPSAEYIDGEDDFATTKQVMDRLLQEAGQFLPQMTERLVIGSYAGLRAKQAPPQEGGFRDFVIKEEERCKGLIDLIGIESPGLTASVPIARYVARLLQGRMELAEKSDFNPVHKGIQRFRELPLTERERLVRADREYGEIICRCETVTKKEIRLAIENPLGTVTLSGIKNRTRCMTGRCQGGYCMARIADILINEYGFAPEDIRLRETGTELFCGRVK